jgi:low temperature requirement protein LtrA
VGVTSGQAGAVERSERAGDDRVTTIELFFDLVFVFTITQLTTLLFRHPSGAGLGQVAVLFANLWWMYGGYAWLTNAVPPRRASQQVLLLCGMAGFLIVAIAIPDAFSTTGVAFGVGYLVATLVHAGLFLESESESTVRAVVRLGPANLVTAAIVLAGGFAHGDARWILWASAAMLHWITPYVFNPSPIGLRPAHFVERHGLILLIALGESAVAVAIGLRGLDLTAGRLASAILGLAISAALWWLYFDRDDRAADRALATAPASKRAWMALYAFGYGFLLVLGSIVVLAGGIRLAAHTPTAVAGMATAWFLAAGASAYCMGLALLRAILSSGNPVPRLALGTVVLASVVFGLEVSALAQLAAVASILIGGIVVTTVTDRRTRPAARRVIPRRGSSGTAR